MADNIYFTQGSFESIALQKAIDSASQVFVLVDSNTLQHTWPIVGKMAGLGDAEILEVEPGETSKSLEICHHLWSALLESNADRNSLLINLGGGVVTDLGGFIGSTFKRGIPFINIPTSLLALVDASSGGKTGINLGHSKNQIGVFNNPELVIIHPEFLETLPQEHLQSGYAEMLKHGLIADQQYWKSLTAIKEILPEKIAPLIQKSIIIKTKIVASDPLEQGERKSLNFGHTFGHAIESALWHRNTPILHGHAVALGMLVAAELSVNHSLLEPQNNLEIQIALGKKFSMQPILNLEFEELIGAIKKDKKNAFGKTNFTLLSSIGESIIDQDVSEVAMKKAYLSIVELAKNNELIA